MTPVKRADLSEYKDRRKKKSNVFFRHADFSYLKDVGSWLNKKPQLPQNNDFPEVAVVLEQKELQRREQLKKRGGGAGGRWTWRLMMTLGVLLVCLVLAFCAHSVFYSVSRSRELPNVHVTSGGDHDPGSVAASTSQKSGRSHESGAPDFLVQEKLRVLESRGKPAVGQLTREEEKPEDIALNRDNGDVESVSEDAEKEIVNVGKVADEVILPTESSVISKDSKNSEPMDVFSVDPTVPVSLMSPSAQNPDEDAKSLTTNVPGFKLAEFVERVMAPLVSSRMRSLSARLMPLQWDNSEEVPHQFLEPPRVEQHFLESSHEVQELSKPSPGVHQPSQKVQEHLEFTHEVHPLPESDRIKQQFLEPLHEIQELLEPPHKVQELLEPPHKVQELLEPPRKIQKLLEPLQEVQELLEPLHGFEHQLNPPLPLAVRLRLSSHMGVPPPRTSTVATEKVNNVEPQTQGEEQNLPLRQFARGGVKEAVYVAYQPQENIYVSSPEHFKEDFFSHPGYLEENSFSRPDQPLQVRFGRAMLPLSQNLPYNERSAAPSPFYRPTGGGLRRLSFNDLPLRIGRAPPARVQRQFIGGRSSARTGSSALFDKLFDAAVFRTPRRFHVSDPPRDDLYFTPGAVQNVINMRN